MKSSCLEYSDRKWTIKWNQGKMTFMQCSIVKYRAECLYKADTLYEEAAVSSQKVWRFKKFR